MRLIIVSFLFMGWAFYELSGGADFQPRVAALTPPEAASEPAQPPQNIAVPAAPARRQIEITGLVATPAIAPAEPGPEPNAEPETPTDTALAQTPPPGLDRLGTGLGQGLSLFPDAGPEQSLTLASIEAGAAGLATAPPAPDAAREPLAEPAEPPADIREVTGTRVNMRDGPGTIYPVIARLTIGREVEVLGTSGTGWLRLRTLTDRQIGWIAASLISKP